VRGLERKRARDGAPPAETGGASTSLKADFVTGSAELTAQARETLDEFGSAVNSSELADRRFRVEGHTDTVGTPDYNEAPSTRRTEAVPPKSRLLPRECTGWVEIG